MNFLYRSAPPAYKGCAPVATPATFRITSGLWGLFAGGGQPAYRQASGVKPTAASAPQGWWPALFGGGVQYRRAPESVVAADEATAPDVVDAVTAIREGWLREEDEVDVALREIHIW
jgi:hypothetical protein